MHHHRQGILAALALVAALWLAPTAQASRTQESIAMDDTLLVYGDDAQVEATFGLLRDLGVDRMRVSVLWRLVAPSAQSTSPPSFDAANPASYSQGAWDRYDRIVNAASRYGIGLLLTVAGPAPRWAAGTGPNGTPTRRPNASEFAAFVTAVGRRYSGTWADEHRVPAPPPHGFPFLSPRPPPPPTQRGPVLPRVSTWSLWNEPNQPGWLSPQAEHGTPVSPRLYRSLADAAWNGLNASGHGQDLILLGETAPRGLRTPGSSGPMRPLVFLRSLYCVSRSLRPLTGRAAAGQGCPTNGRGFAAAHPVLFSASGYAHHPYLLDAAPTRGPRSPDEVVISNLGRLSKTLDRIFRRYRHGRRLPIWITEYGYQTRPPDPTLGIPWRRQADYLGVAEDIAFRNSRVRSMAQFLLVDDAPNSRVPRSSPRYWGTFQSGLITLGGRRKPSYMAYQRPFDVQPRRVRAGKRVRVFGGLRPAPNGAPLAVRVEFKRKGSHRWRRLRNTGTRNFRNYLSVKLRLPRAGSLRLAWRSPTTGRRLRTRAISVRVVKRHPRR